jgi:hypothetical protein
MWFQMFFFKNVLRQLWHSELEFDATQGWREGAAPISAKKNTAKCSRLF